ncbi:protein kinase [Candidatus Sumerlaeota bacterium]|nr:protein kinase [Candidatus Sumerlaeota bacterium]
MSKDFDAKPPRPNHDDVPESPTVMTPQTPKVLGGNKLLKRVGVGGMGEVWLGQDIKLHRQVAIKVMLPDLIKTTPDAAARFYQEARAVAKLNHQNIIQIFQIGEEKGLLFFSMEWVDGESLGDYLKRSGSLDTVAALEIALQMVDGLAFACQHQVIHRDVKPANVMLDKSGRVKITDFGLAKIQDSDLALTSSGMSMGSPNYMSPEMAKGEHVNHRADIYAVGITLFQMLTGSVPFTGPSATAVLLKHIQEPLPIPRGLEEKAGRFLVDVMRKMTEKDAELRYQTYEVLRADLVTALDRAKGGATPNSLQTTPIDAQSLALSGRSTIHVEATPVSNPPSAALPAVKQRSALPVLAIVVGAVLVLLLIVGGVATFVLTKKGSVGTHVASGDGKSLKGQAFVNVDNRVEYIAGQTLLLYQDGERDRLLGIREKLEANQKTLAEDVSKLNSLLVDIRDVAVSKDRSAQLQKELNEKNSRIEQITREGQQAQAKVETYRGYAQFLRKDEEIYRKSNSYTLRNPETGLTQVLPRGTEKEKTSSDLVFKATLAGFDEAAASNAKYVEKLKSDLEDARREAKLAENKINSRAPSGDNRPVEEKRKEFKEIFSRTITAQEARLKLIAEIEAASAKPVSEVKTGPDGSFIMANIADGSYLLKAAYTTTLVASQSQYQYTAIWLEPVSFQAAETTPVSLTQDNTVVNVRKDSLDGIGKPYDPTRLVGALDEFLSDTYSEGNNKALDTYVAAVMTP